MPQTAQDRPTWHNHTLLKRRFAMPLQRGEVLGYDFNRMVVDFTMFNQGKTVRCAISTAAMDDLEGKRDVKADQRVDQFVRSDAGTRRPRTRPPCHARWSPSRRKPSFA